MFTYQRVTWKITGKSPKLWGNGPGPMVSRATIWTILASRHSHHAAETDGAVQPFRGALGGPEALVVVRRCFQLPDAIDGC